jgi:hypothetical protein
VGEEVDDALLDRMLVVVQMKRYVGSLQTFRG